MHDFSACSSASHKKHRQGAAADHPCDRAQNFGVAQTKLTVAAIPAGDALLDGRFSVLRVAEFPPELDDSIQTQQYACGWLRQDRLMPDKEYVPDERARSKTDWDLVRSWFRHCQDDHGRRCEPQPLEMPGLSLIDCLTRSVVPAPQHQRYQYAALSYVWGDRSLEPDTLYSRPLGSFIEVIEDAIRCTLELGLHFLWVDRYCIDQNSPDKHRQIQNMDQIYGSATITLVNAAGESPLDGIPGVSAKSRTQPDSFEFDGQRLMSLPNVRKDIMGSTWSSRAWTFQEGLLSIRRLIFTQSQAYYQCTSMHCCEYIPEQQFSHPVSAMLPNRRFQSAMLALPQLYPDSTHALMTSFDLFLTEYLRRQLSFQADALNAFMGFLRYFWRQQERPIWHFWGVPFWAALNDGHELGNFVFLKQLLWVPIQRTQNTAPLIMRNGLPSWTWAAWQGLSSWALTDSIEQRLIWDKYFDVKVQVEDVQGKRLNMSEYVEYMNSDYNLYNFRPWLYLSGWSVKAHLRISGRGEDSSYWHAFDVARGVAIARVSMMDVELPGDPDCFGPTSNGTWRLFLFAGRDVTDSWAGEMNGNIKVHVTGLVLKPTTESKTFIRIGVVTECHKLQMRVSKGNKRARLWRNSPEQGFECKWHNIKLV